MIDPISSQIPLRLQILDTIYTSGTGHLGGSLSCLAFLSSLYLSDYSNYDFILSKGHASLALYSVLQLKHGSPSLSSDYGKHSDNGFLHGHVSKKADPSIALSSGSLGHGFPFSIGLAYSYFLNSLPSKSIICLLGDGECEEGSTWESLLLLKKFPSCRLLLVIDNNKSQRTFDNAQISSILSFCSDHGISCNQINGHHIPTIKLALNNFFASNEPCVLVLDTVKGYGIPSIHSLEQWHAGKPSREQYELFRTEISSFQGHLST